MSHVNAFIMGRDFDAESKASLLNLKSLTLTNAATLDAEPIRKGEFDTAYTDHETRIAAMEGSSMHLDTVYVDETSADLATAIALGSFADNEWTFGSKTLSEGDLLILANAGDEEQRSWVVNGKHLGTAEDFTALASDVDSQIQAAVDALIGGASTEYDTLKEIEDVIKAMDTAYKTADSALDARLTLAESDVDSLEAAVALRPELKFQDGVFTDNGDGTYTFSFANPYNSVNISVDVSYNTGAGVYNSLSLGQYDLAVSASTIELNTTSPTVGGHSVKVVMNGIVTI